MSELGPCPRSLEIGRAAQPEADPRLAAHLEECPRCQAERRSALRVAALAQDLPWTAPSPDQLAGARRAAIAAAVQRQSRRPRWVRAVAVGAVSLCAATVAAAVGTRVLTTMLGPAVTIAPGPRAPAPHRRPRPARRPPEPPSAPVQEPPAVPPPATRPASPPAVSPVRPRSVASSSPLRYRDRDRDRAEAPALAPRPTPAQAAPPAPAPAPAATPSERAFAEGWEALRAGDYGSATEHLERSAALAPTAPLAEDARYWRAVALVRAGQRGRGRAAMEEYLQRHGGSPRAGEVSAMLGWLLLEGRECAAARTRFSQAADDHAASTRQSAREGLAASAACLGRDPGAR
jgi:hypothetical protein